MTNFVENIIENIQNLEWGYILGTLVIRFVGVFVVLVLFVDAKSCCLRIGQRWIYLDNWVVLWDFGV